MFTAKGEAWEIQGPTLATLLLLLLLVAKKITKQLAGAWNFRITRKSSQLHRCRRSHESFEANKKIANYYLHQIEKLSR
jgi:F0F1-type ATP synthase membrane subunit b/b'